MGKIQVCLDSACLQFRMVEDGKLIQQRKKECDKDWVPPEGFDKEFDAMMRATKEISIASPNTFDTTSKVGDELVLSGKKDVAEE